MSKRKSIFNYIVNFRKILIYFLILIALASSVFYLDNKINNSNNEANFKIKCVASDARILKKIQNLNSLKISDDDVIIIAISIYKNASKQAEDNDGKYMMSELVADVMVDCYIKGLRNGKKKYDGQI